MTVVCISINVLLKGRQHQELLHMIALNSCLGVPSLKLRTSVRFCDGLVVENSQLLSKEVRAKESTVVMVTCLAGFSLIGSEEVSCLTDGTWTTVPTCHKRGESLNCRASDIQLFIHTTTTTSYH